MLEKLQNRVVTRTSKHPYEIFLFQSIITIVFSYSNNDPTVEFTLLPLLFVFLMPLKCIFSFCYVFMRDN